MTIILSSTINELVARFYETIFGVSTKYLVLFSKTMNRERAFQFLSGLKRGDSTLSELGASIRMVSQGSSASRINPGLYDASPLGLAALASQRDARIRFHRFRRFRYVCAL
jgi:hypothetical protein